MGLPFFFKQGFIIIVLKSSHSVILKYNSEFGVVREDRGDLCFIVRQVTSIYETFNELSCPKYNNTVVALVLDTHVLHLSFRG